MADSNAIHSYGSTLSMSDTSGGSYTAVSEVINYDFSAKVGSSNVTHLTSDTATMEKKPKFRDPGAITFECNFYKTQFATLYTAFTGRAQKFWKITLPDASILGPFKAHISDIKLNVPDDDRITNSITLDISNDGDSFTAGA